MDSLGLTSSALGRAGREHVGRNFSRETFTRNVGGLYAAMLGG